MEIKINIKFGNTPISGLIEIAAKDAINFVNDIASKLFGVTIDSDGDSDEDRQYLDDSFD